MHDINAAPRLPSAYNKQNYNIINLVYQKKKILSHDCRRNSSIHLYVQYSLVTFL